MTSGSKFHLSWSKFYRWFKKSGAKKNKVKTVNVFFGFFLIINYCLGTGFLGIPYAFFYGGYLASIPTIIFISVVSWINANYLLEVMARAQALEYFDKFKNPSSGESDADTDYEQKDLTTSFIQEKAPSIKEHPKFELTPRRKFEVAELCQIFYNKYMKYTYLVVLSLHNFLVRWSFAAVAASAWAVNIPFDGLGAAEECKEDAFQHNIIPTGGCLYSYYFSLMMFGLIVVTLSMFDIKEQAFIQFILGILRFVTIGAMIIYCIVRLSDNEGDACEDLEFVNLTGPLNVELEAAVVKFDPRGWLLGIPIFTYAFIFHTGLSSLAHPIKQKQYLHYVVIGVFIVALASYMCLGIIVPLWFRASIQETCTLNWAIFTRPVYPIQLRLLSYYLVLFPALDVISAYPLLNHVIVNNLYIFITGHDTSKEPRFKFDRFLQIFLRLVNAVLPILAALGVANLIYVLKYAGLVGFMCFMFPFLLQVKSIYTCKKRFSMIHVSLSGSHSALQKKQEPASNEDRSRSGSPFQQDLSSEVAEEKDTKVESLISPKEKKIFSFVDKEKALYTTPYSNVFFSNPKVVWVVGFVGSCVFILACLSLFLHPKKLTCDTIVEEMLALLEL